jgi:hypothetical protein
VLLEVVCAGNDKVDISQWDDFRHAALGSERGPGASRSFAAGKLSAGERQLLVGVQWKDRSSRHIQNGVQTEALVASQFD